MTSITCNICKTWYDADDYADTQEFTHINFRAGYGSVFGDGNSVELDICQYCLRDHLGKYLRIKE